ncbi:metallophosphoesterase, partial [Burkholderia pseudomallei]|uniref:metallophosphoesterase n=1 Tax=Burkholderia pseudomallei TaxID=28450 RepID=UPI0021BB9CB9
MRVRAARTLRRGSYVPRQASRAVHRASCDRRPATHDARRRCAAHAADAPNQTRHDPNPIQSQRGTMMLLAHISDLHIKRPGALAYRRVDTAAHLARCVARLNALEPRPDAVLVTGDLTDFGDDDEYAHLKALLAP